MIAMSRLKTWNFAGNYVSSVGVDAPHAVSLEKVRRTVFFQFTTFSARLTAECLQSEHAINFLSLAESRECRPAP